MNDSEFDPDAYPPPAPEDRVRVRTAWFNVLVLIVGLLVFLYACGALL